MLKYAKLLKVEYRDDPVLALWFLAPAQASSPAATLPAPQIEAAAVPSATPAYVQDGASADTSAQPASQPTRGDEVANLRTLHPPLPTAQAAPSSVTEILARARGCDFPAIAHTRY